MDDGIFEVGFKIFERVSEITVYFIKLIVYIFSVFSVVNLFDLQW